MYFWPRTISNKDLLQQTEQDEMRTILKQHRWRWIGHVLVRERTSITRSAVHWTQGEKRKRQTKPNSRGRDTTTSSMLEHNIDRAAKDGRLERKSLVAALCSSRRYEDD